MGSKFRTLLILSLCGCYTGYPPVRTRPSTFSEIQLGAQVSPALLIQAADAQVSCIGRPYNLDGWTAWVAADTFPCVDGRCFMCPEGAEPMCGPPPAGYTEETAPCECRGYTDFESKRIALTPDLKSLEHEVKHAGWLLVSHMHVEPEWQCKEVEK